MELTKISLTRFGLTALAALIVSACGSSGGGSSSDNQPQQNNASNNSQISQQTNKTSDNKTSDNKTSDNKTSDNKTSDNKTSDNKTSDNKTSDNKTSDNKTSDNKTSDNKTSDNKTSDNKTSDNKTTDNKTSDNKTSNNQLQQERNGTGTAIVISGSNDNVNAQTSTLNHYNTTSINIDGVDIIIGLQDLDIQDWTLTGFRGRKLEVCCGRYSDIRFGVSDSLNESSNGYMFYNGNPTQNMPTSGTATYSGDAIISAENIYGLDPKDYYRGSSKFNVNFGNKTLEGSLSIPNGNRQPVKVEINAKISSNAFTGTTNSTTLQDGQVEGKFYGSNAKEMAGLAQGNDKSWGAAFGAAKQQ
ncbi:Slam-dependent surface lipoprotein [Rodentibacter pneumotropicus]|uniref:Slam-dependent surface lipoprotein n=1 Tax=Rodentibacter pneumotropicus TaxID=758 RepID=UPI00037F3B34|nr:Slam-dependent surface lipoprotein [Rodentibacter pneumotropicus]